MGYELPPSMMGRRTLVKVKKMIGIVVVGGVFILSNKNSFVQVLEKKLEEQAAHRGIGHGNCDVHPVHCPSCNVQLPDHFKYCNKCGFALDLNENNLGIKESTIEGSDMICTTCGANVPSFFHYCNKCGISLQKKIEDPKTRMGG